MKKYLKYSIAAFVILGVAFALYSSLKGKDALEGIAYGNGRIEAETIDIATRSSGRVLTVPVEEGQMVGAGDIVATLDLENIAASLAGAEANVRASVQQRDEAASMVEQAESELDLARKEFARAENLIRSGTISQSRQDQVTNQKRSAEASLRAAQQRLLSASAAIDVAKAETDRLKDILKDRELRASKAGRVLYKLAEPGEVLPSGGKVVTLLDLSDVYMTLFLPTAEIGLIRLGDEARIIVDALPDTPIPAYVSYISPEAQFTPRQVETRSEREKLTFRIKVKIPSALLNRHLDAVKTGVPGMAYIRMDRTQDWPESLKVAPALMKEAQSESITESAAEPATEPVAGATP